MHDLELDFYPIASNLAYLVLLLQNQEEAIDEEIAVMMALHGLWRLAKANFGGKEGVLEILEALDGDEATEGVR